MIPLNPGAWTLDLAHTTVEFGVRHLGISQTRGRFTRFDAEIHVGTDLASTSIRATVDLSSVDTGNAARDDHLRGSDFFSVETHPSMVFESTQLVELGDQTYRVDGTLTLNGRSRPFSLDLQFLGTAVFPGDGSFHAGFSASGKLSRKEFGLDFNVPLETGGFVIGDRVDVELDVELLPVEVAAAS